jgi:hypothetical protein
MRVSIYLGKDKQWLVAYLTNLVAGAKMLGRETSVGQELLRCAEQHILQGVYLGEYELPKLEDK